MDYESDLENAANAEVERQKYRYGKSDIKLDPPRWARLGGIGQLPAEKRPAAPRNTGNGILRLLHTRTTSKRFKTKGGVVAGLGLRSTESVFLLSRGEVLTSS